MFNDFSTTSPCVTHFLSYTFKYKKAVINYEFKNI